MAKEDCKALLVALSAVTACFRQLVLAVGSTADSPKLREELKTTRQKAQELAVANRTKLTTALRDGTADREDRQEFERFWVCFSTCLEILEFDMRRALELGRAFPLNAPQQPLIQTGVSGRVSGVAVRAIGAQKVKREEADLDQSLDAADLMELEHEIDQMGKMIYEMEMKVNVPQWTVEAKQDPGAELNSSASVGASSIGVISVENKAFCDHSKVLAGSVFTALLLVAVALAVCVAKLT